VAGLCEKRWFRIIFAYYARWLHTFTSSISRIVNRSIANRCRYVSSGVCRLLKELQSYTGRVPVVGDACFLPR